MTTPTSIRILQWSMLALVVLLTLEGLLRKCFPGAISLLIFLLKDVFVLIIAAQVLVAKRSNHIDFLWTAYFIVAVLFIPVILSTTIHDPILAVFGIKQYLLYPMVAFGLFTAFENSSYTEINRFFRRVALLLIPVTATAFIQTRLPASHWLNLSVEGGDLEGFGTGGHLRVSATFSFVAQFSTYLNAQVFILAVAMSRFMQSGFFWKILLLALVPCLVGCSYVTGSRGAVVANLVIILLAGGLSMLRFEFGSVFRIAAVIGVLVGIVSVAQYLLPDVFAVYSTREQGHMVGVSGEVRGRVFDALFGWTGAIFSTPLFGSGIGLMSNGSDLFSSYADSIREQTWTETDIASTLYEGGIYLVVVWYSFRYWVVYQTTKLYVLRVKKEYSLAAGFCQGFIILLGITGTLGIQPPIAIWWWLGVGTSLLFWRKSVESTMDDEPTPEPVLAEPKKQRGRSTYAERLHEHK